MSQPVVGRCLGPCADASERYLAPLACDASERDADSWDSWEYLYILYIYIYIYCDFNIYSFSILNSPVGVAVDVMFRMPTSKGDQQMPGGHL